MTSDDKLKYREIPLLLLAMLPWIAVLGFGGATVTKAFGASRLTSSSPAVLSIVLIVLLTSLTPAFLAWTRRPTRAFWVVTSVAWLAAIVILAGRLMGWISAPR
jgi:hypothetical protein